MRGFALAFALVVGVVAGCLGGGFGNGDPGTDADVDTDTDVDTDVDADTDADDDNDGDGWTNAEERESYTDPDDPEDHPYEFGDYPMDPCRNDIVSTGYTPGDIAPNFEMPDQFGQTVKLHDFCDHTVLLTIGAMWCGSCIEAARHQRALYDELAHVGLWPMQVSAWGPDGDPCTVDDLAAWAEQYDLVTPVLWDNTYDATGEYMRQGNGLPHRVLIAPGMEVITIGKYDEDELREMILDISGG